MKKNIIPLLLFFSFSTTFLFAKTAQSQTYKLLYRFIDKETGKPIDGVNVRILNTKNNAEQVTITTQDGETLVYLEPETTFLIRAYNRYYFSTDTIRLQTQKLSFEITKDDERRSIKKDIPLEKINIGLVKKLIGVSFSPNSDKILPECENILKRLAYMMRLNPSIKIEVAAHTDSRGEDEYNLELTQRQANSLREFLIIQGIAEDRIRARGFGENQLVNQCQNDIKCTSSEHIQNRRVEYVIIGIE
ncbi:outer membrane protein/peptidoglycan-associated (lipo)protein [Bernardetia litoralis DSM 6794]|uniref:Outer membrane protein/peptidoglycan-associated (Lipo)protein n=1 Tax=Bernardetia litoralis (strain ATCC 23117 / DSM 6794 / NBRC 15988 / NCIMB 1366 / Fx l1 / Sio-4) TaxID=880071 RepID=I4AKS8_BERLS|nr:OmpA family protein [Bernardetia litoralis]AFM04563.1 outer membrane protein/peptidoglycan-associated (lipo)protein [Bernardetia litoralis DSM 6794]